MNEPIILKTDLLSRLNEIYNQLEELQEVLHSSYLVQQGNVQKLEKKTLDSCTEKISNLESNVMNRPVEHERKSIPYALEAKSRKKASTIHLELGLKGL